MVDDLPDQSPAAPPSPAHAPSGAGRVVAFDPQFLLEHSVGPALTRAGFALTYHPTPGQAVAAATGDADVVLLAPGDRHTDAVRVLESLSVAGVLHGLPVMVLVSTPAIDDTAASARAMDYLELGADVVVPLASDPRLVRVAVRARVERRRRLVDERSTSAMRLVESEYWLAKVLDQVIPIGAAATKESDFDRLLERIVVGAMDVAAADGGTLYLREGDALRFAILQTRSMNVAAGGTSGTPIAIPPLPLHDPITGEPNHRSVATHAALTGRTVNVRDVYLAEDHDFAGAKAFDARTGYRTKSLLTVPLNDAAGRLVGVLQFVNAASPDGGVGTFGPGNQRVVEGHPGLAAAVLASSAREHALRAQVRELRIEVDETRKAKQVAEIVTTDYFKGLQQRAVELRRRAALGAADQLAASQAATTADPQET
jgi:hypothetical protein